MTHLTTVSRQAVLPAKADDIDDLMKVIDETLDLVGSLMSISGQLVSTLTGWYELGAAKFGW